MIGFFVITMKTTSLSNDSYQALNVPFLMNNACHCRVHEYNEGSLKKRKNTMLTLKLNSKLLAVLQMVQCRKQLALVESELGMTSSWYADTRESFFALPNSLVSELGLAKNIKCFRAIESLTVPEEWLTTEAHELDAFEFCY
jgi:hypothetical protein